MESEKTEEEVGKERQRRKKKGLQKRMTTADNRKQASVPGKTWRPNLFVVVGIVFPVRISSSS